MFSRSKEQRGVRSQNRGDLSKYGLLDIPIIDDSGIDVNGYDTNSCEDDALEAELLALTSGSVPVQRIKKPTGQNVNLDSMVAESMQEVPSDDDVSVDENDSVLLNELNDLVDDNEDSNANDNSHFNQGPPECKEQPSGENILKVLRDRLNMYEEAEKNAKSNGETSRARRLGRGVKTLNEMIKRASGGKVIQEEDIPPPVVITTKRKTDETNNLLEDNLAIKTSPSPSNLSEELMTDNVSDKITDSSLEAEHNNGSDFMNFNTSDGSGTEIASSCIPGNANILEALVARRNEFKNVALNAKRHGDSEKALRYVRIVKQFEPVITAAEAGQLVDLDSIPPPPEEYELQISASSKDSPKKSNAEMQRNASAKDLLGETAEMMAAAAAAQEDSTAAADPSLDSPRNPLTVLEALEQRLEKYISAEQAAKEEGNSSKARRLGRIVKQYHSAIKSHKEGKPIPVDELPTPPGFGPIPVEDAQVPPNPSLNKTDPSAPSVPVSCLGPKTDPLVPQSNSPDSKSNSNESVQSASSKAKPSGSVTRQEKQLSLLLNRQKKFREAAIEAKRRGEMNQAKEYLRISKGFDPLIEACKSGLPIDSSSLPVAPECKRELENEFDIVTFEDCIPGSDSSIYEKLEEDLLKQTKMCLTTRDHFKATGDIASANRFEQLAVHSKKDLDAVKYAHKRNDPIPKFHYEARTFSIVQCCTELGDNDLELSIIQGINYNVPNPKEIDTYVKFEFPYPTETPARDRTGLIKNTNNPQYNQTFLIPIQRNVRACQRVFKRHAIKFEVWSRGGFFRGDSLVGTASAKLMPLETKCIIHDAFDLMDGRKALGGKLEVKVRVRHPILTKQVEKVEEKWLVIDQYL